MSTYPITCITSHIDDINAKGNHIFSRDCPEYAIDLGEGKTIVVLPNHIKSKRGGDSHATKAHRTAQVIRANEIALSTLTHTPYVLMTGNLNDTPTSPELAAVFSNGFTDVINHPS